jgi:hypothetical protein
MGSRRSITIIVSLIAMAASVKIALACCDFYDPFEADASFFLCNINNQPQYSPFYFNTYFAYNDPFTGEKDAKSDALPDANISEWQEQCNGAVKRDDIDSFMNTFSYADVKALSDEVVAIDRKIKDNTFSHYLMRKGNRQFLKYMLYAKQCEPYNRELGGSWDNKTGKFVYDTKDTSDLQRMIYTGVNCYNNTDNGSLKWRYAFQVLRLAFYNGNYQQTIDLYDGLIGDRQARNVMYPRCLSLRAGALFRTGQRKRAAYLFSRAFDLSDDMKQSAYLSYSWAKDSMPTEALLPICSNAHERAVLWMMQGLHEQNDHEFDGYTSMKNAYAMDPAVSGLNMVMVRDIQKIELRYMQDKEQSLRNPLDSLTYFRFMKGNTDEAITAEHYLSYMSKLTSFALRVATDNKRKDRAFWYLSAAYLSYMQDKFNDCTSYLAEAGDGYMNPTEHDEHEIINILVTLKTAPVITQDIEARILPSLKWLDKKGDGSERYRTIFQNMLRTGLTNAYLKQGDTIRAVYCLAHSNCNDEYRAVSPDFSDLPGNLIQRVSMEQFRAMEAFVQRRNKTEFETWITAKTPYPYDVLRELEGTRLIRQMRFAEAAKVLSTVKTFREALPDVCVSHIQDHSSPGASDSGTLYTKLSLARKMVQLEAKLKAEPHNARAAYQYANVLYNISYYGTASYAYTYDHSTVDDYAYYETALRKALPLYEREYYDVRIPQRYYMIAFANSSDRELKARCLFLAAKCWQKNCPAPEPYGAYDDHYYLNGIKNPYFLRLKGYNDTRSYTEAYINCSYLRDYLNR